MPEFCSNLVSQFLTYCNLTLVLQQVLDEEAGSVACLYLRTATHAAAAVDDQPQLPRLRILWFLFGPVVEIDTRRQLQSDDLSHRHHFPQMRGQGTRSKLLQLPFQRRVEHVTTQMDDAPPSRGDESQ